jgi:hypothetical protein
VEVNDLDAIEYEYSQKGLERAALNIPSLIREVEQLRETVGRYRTRLINCHELVCTAENCVLDGEAEHQSAFPADALLSARKETGDE